MKAVLILAGMFVLATCAEAAKMGRTAGGVDVIIADQVSYMTGLRHKPAALKGLGETHVTLADCDNLPAEFDLRDLDVVPPVKDQGACGSCWAFSQTASLESAHAVNTGRGLDLSEQQLVSCDRAQWGCNGGLLNTFSYQIKNGQTGEVNFPYAAADLSCRTGLPVVAQGQGYVYVRQWLRKPTERQVMCALYKSHTIPWITVSANERWGTPPTSTNGVYTACGRGQTNHAVGLVGWKTIGGRVYMKMRNSWGPRWGSNAGRPGMERGYMMMPLGCDNLGEEVAYITTKAMKCVPPEVRLPAQMVVDPEAPVRLSVRPEDGVTYGWQLDGKTAGEGPSVDVAPASEGVYKVTATNGCGTAESSIRVTIVAP